MPALAISNRVRNTPFTPRVEAAGVAAYTVYNHMLLPAAFASIEEDYHHLKSAVQIWDVACERQVELVGPDAAKVAQLLTPRDISRQKIGQCTYTPTCDRKGRVLNDPVTVKLADDRYWVSVADSDILLFAQGLAEGTDLDVSIFEPDISPLGIQGPKSVELMSRVFGAGIDDMKHFGTQIHRFGGRDHIIARSGYSGQGGFEIYLNGSDLGLPLWDALMEAGRDLDVRAGCPNLIERIESGLLSYGNDMWSEHTLAETGLDRFCTRISPDSLGGKAVLAAGAPTRQLRYLTIDGAPMTAISNATPATHNGKRIGTITSGVWSPDYQTNVAIGIIDASHWDTDATFQIDHQGLREVTVLPQSIASK